MEDNNYKFKGIENSYNRTPDTADDVGSEASSRTFMNRVYNWMAGGLVITGLLAYFISQYMLETGPVNSPTVGISGGSIFWSSGFMLVMVLIEFGLVMWISMGIRKMSPSTAGICFLVYAAINGVTLAPILLVYAQQSTVYAAFFACAGMFAVTSLFGYLTHQDLSGMGSFLLMGLFGLIIASVINMFVKSAGFDRFLTYIGVFLFLGLTAWDTQKLKQMGGVMSENDMNASDSFRKFAILGALTLYLDFINLFLMLLKLFGNRGRD